MSVYDIPPDPAVSSLEERVAALEAIVATPPQFILPLAADLTAEQVAEIRSDIEAARKAGPYEHRGLSQPPPLSPEQVRQLLSECVTVVKPGETLVIRGHNWTPNQVREIQRVMDALREDGRISFKVLAVIAEGLAVAEPAEEASGAG